jgi:frataxin-like iron-binding protein CyaY
VFTISVRWNNDAHERAAYTAVQEYEIEDGVLTLAFDNDHDLVIPLFQVTSVDIVREEH